MMDTYIYHCLKSPLLYIMHIGIYQKLSKWKGVLKLALFVLSNQVITVWVAEIELRHDEKLDE